MSKIVALLSGKGGSGKTTLALSMASMLSSCDIKVLLIDCDLSTNGATYFYENRLSEHNGDIVSFYKMIFGLAGNKGQFININKNMDFIPSIVQITKKSTEIYTYREETQNVLKEIKDNYNDKYDVILLDCQAGYTETLKVILPIVDVNLVVMEADAISSAAMRSLYLKIGDYLNEMKIYQIFNKATEEEYKIYSKISGGTVFTNIETVKFDWKIRKAFSVAEVPDMEKTSAAYGLQIFNICKILFKEKSIQTRLNKYEIAIELNKNSEEEKQLKDAMNELQEKKWGKRKTTFLFNTVMMLALGVMVILVLYYVMEIEISFYEPEYFMLNFILFIAVIMLIFVGAIVLMESVKDHRNIYKQMDIYRKELENVLENKRELQKRYEQFNKRSESATSERATTLYSRNRLYRRNIDQTKQR